MSISRIADLMQDAAQCRYFFLLAACCLMVATGGCGSGLESSVTGTITYAGKPVPNAIISFQDKSGGAGAYAMTNESGEYSLRTGSNQGALQGTYRACLQPPQGFELPAKYGSVRTSELEFEVKEGANVIDITLE